MKTTRIPASTLDWSAVFDADTPGVRPRAGWHNDHLYFQRLLDLLEKELDVFHCGTQPDEQHRPVQRCSQAGRLGAEIELIRV